MKRIPDGWVAWHPKYGKDLRTMRLTLDSAIVAWKCHHAQSYFTPQQWDIYKNFERAWEFAKDDGWQILGFIMELVDAENSELEKEK